MINVSLEGEVMRGQGARQNAHDVFGECTE